MKGVIVFAVVSCFFSSFAIAADLINKDEVRSLLGEIYSMQKDYPKAEEQYRKVLDKDPGNVGARVALADILSWKKDYPAAVLQYSQALKLDPDNSGILLKLARVSIWSGAYPEAKNIVRRLLSIDPNNSEALALSGQISAYSGNYASAADSYRRSLEIKYDRRAAEDLADVLSWNMEYSAAVDMYDKLLAEKEDVSSRLKKARVLGWMHNYPEAIKEYRCILEKGEDAAVLAEMRAKEAYWNNRAVSAVRYFNELRSLSPENTEGMFDLGQVYSYQGRWDKARQEYERAVSVSGGHSRAEVALEKTRLYMREPLIESGYEFLEADSAGRDSDIRRHTISNKISVPLAASAQLNLGYDFSRHAFSDFRNVSENRQRIGVVFNNLPEWLAEINYSCRQYWRHIGAINEFSGAWESRFDAGDLRLSYDRQRLDNNSAVIRQGYYADNYKGRFDLDINKRLKAGGDYLYAYYSDSNSRNESGADILYRVSLQPRAFYVKYRYSFRDFRFQEHDYFSPKYFSANSLILNLRQYLNAREVFWGMDEVYYDLGYELCVDSEGVVGHTFKSGFSRDISKKLKASIEGQWTHLSSDTYSDKRLQASLKYFF